MPRKNLKNYTSGWTINKSLSEIQKMLASKGAKKMMIDYEDGEPQGITFAIETPKGLMPVALPIRHMNVVKVMYGQLDVSEDQLEQAKRTAWRNIHDWIDAQLALLETEMVKMEQIFLPYVMMGDKTIFERFESGTLLQSGK